jgi:hypothetical protein
MPVQFALQWGWRGEFAKIPRKTARSAFRGRLDGFPFMTDVALTQPRLIYREGFRQRQG